MDKKEIWQIPLREALKGQFNAEMIAYHKDQIIKAILESRTVPQEVIDSHTNPLYQAQIQKAFEGIKLTS